MRKGIRLLAALLALSAMALSSAGCAGGSGEESKVTFDLNWYGPDTAGCEGAVTPAPAWFNMVKKSITLPQVQDADGEMYFTENGYYVGAWYEDRSLTKSAGSALTGTTQYTPSGSCTLYAYWTTKYLAIVWDLNYPDGSEPTAEELEKCHVLRTKAGVVFATSNVPAPAAQPDGTEFVCWSDSEINGEGEMVVAGETKVPFEETTYYAHWKYPITITYLLPDGSVHATKGQKAYDEVELPAEPAMDPCFLGWFDAQGNQLLAGDVMKKDAVYTASSGYTLSIKDKNGTVEDGVAAVQKNAVALSIISEPDDIANGNYVEGYYADKECTTKVAYNDGVLLPNVAGLTDASGRWIGDSSVTLYADWKELSKIGSTLVFYIDKDGGRAASKYKFYDDSNNIVTATEDSGNDYGVTFGGTPVKYAYYGEGKDRYYVVNGTIPYTYKYPWSYYTGSGVEEYSAAYKQEKLLVGESYQVIGAGRSNTAYMLEYDGGAYVKASADNKGTGTAGKGDTLWYAIQQLNEGQLKDNATGDCDNLGCGDWFVPSIDELFKVARMVNNTTAGLDGISSGAPKKTATTTDPWYFLTKAFDTDNSTTKSHAWSSTGSLATDSYIWYSKTSGSSTGSKGITRRLVAVRAF